MFHKIDTCKNKVVHKGSWNTFRRGFLFNADTPVYFYI